MPFTSETVAELPPALKRGGRTPIKPELEGWVKSLAGKPGNHQLIEDGVRAFTFPRSTTLREIVEGLNLKATHTVMTRPAVDAKGEPIKGKYLIFVVITAAPAPNGAKDAKP